MKMLEDRIRKDGIVREGNVLKVDSFTLLMKAVTPLLTSFIAMHKA